MKRYTNMYRNRSNSLEDLLLDPQVSECENKSNINQGENAFLVNNLSDDSLLGGLSFDIKPVTRSSAPTALVTPANNNMSSNSSSMDVD